MRTKTVIAIACLALLLPISALAEEGEASADDAPSVLTIGLKAGAGMPQLGTSMETTYQVRLEAGYLFPALGSRLGLITAIGYSQPEASGTGADDRLPDGTYSWEMTQRQTTWDIGLLGRIMPWSSDWNLTIAVGAQVMFLSTLTKGEAGGEPFGQHDEQATLAGVFVGLQAEYRLGPGALFLELAYTAAFQDLETTGDVTSSTLGTLLGYRFAFDF